MAVLRAPLLPARAQRPTAVLAEPEALIASASTPTAVLLPPSVLNKSALRPMAVLKLPKPLFWRAGKLARLCPPHQKEYRGRVQG